METISYPNSIDYGRLTDDMPRSKTTTIKSARNSTGREYYLCHKTTGYAPGGSMAVWHNGCYQVLFMLDGSQNGQSFKTLEEAEERFHLWTSK